MKKITNAIKAKLNAFMEKMGDEMKDDLAISCGDFWCDYDPWLVNYPNPCTELYLVNGSFV